jgi:hypothetical protein
MLSSLEGENSLGPDLKGTGKDREHTRATYVQAEAREFHAIQKEDDGDPEFKPFRTF